MQSAGGRQQTIVRRRTSRWKEGHATLRGDAAGDGSLQAAAWQRGEHFGPWRQARTSIRWTASVVTTRVEASERMLSGKHPSFGTHLGGRSSSGAVGRQAVRSPTSSPCAQSGCLCASLRRACSGGRSARRMADKIPLDLSGARSLAIASPACPCTPQLCAILKALPAARTANATRFHGWRPRSRLVTLDVSGKRASLRESG